ncbi:hypothetical protein DPMN_130876 [Dreissena polymorpha]|uniref:Uncharacterized protein n=1 Tax=Dreissena polymorpha TaxID=45954 RepID=A0A9D4JYS6_DREPO|nr:hypothetical protein DPMN_130876 [Dreissena polymorpha]
MILKSDNERHSYGPDKLIPPARQPASPPASQPARIRQSNNQFFPSENLVKKEKNIARTRFRTSDPWSPARVLKQGFRC